MASSIAAWTTYEPSANDPWDLPKAAHLLRRAGFGPTRDELQRDRKSGFKASVERLLNPPVTTSQEQRLLEALERSAIQSQDPDRLKACWLSRMLWGPDPLREKLTLFWHSHFATSQRKVQSLVAMAAQNDFLRRNALGNFRDLLAGIVVDPAMLIWLDGGTSRPEQPNENFAREFLELFTLGPGQYSEIDVRQAARAFTGWTQIYSPREAPGFQFDPARFDAGEKTFLGQTGAWRSEDIVRIVLDQPTTAEFLCKKLYRFLVNEADEPSAELIAPLAAEFHASGYSLRHVVEIILKSRHFYAPESRRQRVAAPVEFSVGLLRMLQVPRKDVNLLALTAACTAQGQDLFFPPSVKGWEGGRSWLNSATLLARTNWANDVVWGNSAMGMRPWDVQSWSVSSKTPPGEVIPALIELILEDAIEPDMRNQILRTATDGGNESVRRALQILLHCPECQLS